MSYGKGGHLFGLIQHAIISAAFEYPDEFLIQRNRLAEMLFTLPKQVAAHLNNNGSEATFACFDKYDDAVSKSVITSKEDVLETCAKSIDALTDEMLIRLYQGQTTLVPGAAQQQEIKRRPIVKIKPRRHDKREQGQSDQASNACSEPPKISPQNIVKSKLKVDNERKVVKKAGGYLDKEASEMKLEATKRKLEQGYRRAHEAKERKKPILLGLDDLPVPPQQHKRIKGRPCPTNDIQDKPGVRTGTGRAFIY